MPAWPSRSTIVPLAIWASAPAAPITAGMPSEWARIAACEVRVPSSLTRPTTCSRSSWTVRPGESSWAMTTTCSSMGMDHSSRSERPISWVDHPQLDGMEIGQALPQPGLAGPEIPELQRLELVGGLGAELVVADQRLGRGEKILVLGHEDLRVEDAGLLRPGPLEHLLPQIAQLLHHFLYRVPEALNLFLHLVRPHRAVRHLGEIEAHDQRRGEGHARRHADPPDRARHLRAPRSRRRRAARAPRRPARRRRRAPGW